MKLDIEKWMEEAMPLSETGDILFKESVICYKNSAYRSAYLMSYLAFMTTIKDRILKYEKCPNNVNVKYWEMVLRDLNDEQKWEETVLNLLQMPSYEMNFLICSGNSSINDFDTHVMQGDKEDLKSSWLRVKEKLDPELVDYSRNQRYTIEFRDVKFTGNEKKESKNRRKADIFEITINEPDFAKQLAYYRTLRNQCAHGKSVAMEFSSSYVESLWIFMKSYLPRLRVGGDVEYWKEKIVNCYLFYKDDLSLYETFFSELKVCSFSDDILCEIWSELLDKMKLSFDSWEGKIVGDFEFLKYICENEWCRNSFLKYIKDDFASLDAIYNSKFVLIYVKMKKHIAQYVQKDISFWKGVVFEKIGETLKNKPETYDYMFEIWYDLVSDLENNKEKQQILVKSLPLKALAQMNYKKHISELQQINYFYIMYKEIRLYTSISNNYSEFSIYWRNDTEFKMWFWDNVLGVMEEKNDSEAQTYKTDVKIFLQQVKDASENSLDYYMEKFAADEIIKLIESEKYHNIKSYWEKIVEAEQ